MALKGIMFNVASEEDKHDMILLLCSKQKYKPNKRKNKLLEYMINNLREGEWVSKLIK